MRFRACVPRRMASDFFGFRARPLCRNQDESDRSADSRLVRPGSVNVARLRQWRRVDYDKLRDDLLGSALLQNPQSDVSELFACYDETLRSLVDRHAPFSDVRVHAHPNAPWYDTCCRIKKSKTRRLERAYRKCKTEESFEAWRSQSRYLRYILRELINTICSNLEAENKLVYWAGDFNINILNADDHKATGYFLHTMMSNSFYPAITKPTRIIEF